MESEEFSIRVLSFLVFALLFSSAKAQDEHGHLPGFKEVAAFFETNEPLLNRINDRYQADSQIDWVQCGNDGEFRATSLSETENIEVDSASHEFFEMMCRKLDIWLVQRVDSGVSIHWKDMKTVVNRFRIELYRTEEEHTDSCKDQDFRSPISSCMVPLSSSWAVRYTGILRNDT